MDIKRLKLSINSVYRICEEPNGYEFISVDQIKAFNNLVNSKATKDKAKNLRNKWPSVHKEIKDIINNASGLSNDNKKILTNDIKDISKSLDE